MRLLVLGIGAALLLGTTVASGFGAAAGHAPGCRRVEPTTPRVEHLKRPPQRVHRSDRLLAVVGTSCGRFEFKLDAKRSPTVVNSFVYLARSGFYNGLDFYRVVPNFVVQAGDPSGSGRGGPGYHVVDPPPAHFRYRVGTVAMAKTNAEPRGYAGSVFFVVVGQGNAIAPDYAELGKVRAGMAAVRRISRLGTESERPSQVVRIDWVRIRRY